MPYRINGIELIQQPTSGRWVPREKLGIDGNGHPIYAATREFELEWNLENATGTYQLQNFFDTIHITGSAVIDLPRYGYFDYQFFAYSGTVVHEPDFERYFTEHLPVTMLVTNIRT